MIAGAGLKPFGAVVRVTPSGDYLQTTSRRHPLPLPCSCLTGVSEKPVSLVTNKSRSSETIIISQDADERFLIRHRQATNGSVHFQSLPTAR